MATGILSNTALVFIYGGVLSLGLAFITIAIISLLRSFSPGSQTRPKGSPHPLFSRATTYSLGLGMAVFGGVGLLVVLLLRLDPVAGILVSLGAGLIVGLIALGLLVYLPSRGKAVEALLDFDATGRRAEVIINIPGNGLGEVSFRNGRERIKLGARSATGQPISAQTSVVIERVTMRVAVVSPLVEGGNIIIERPS